MGYLFTTLHKIDEVVDQHEVEKERGTRRDKGFCVVITLIRLMVGMFLEIHKFTFLFTIQRVKLGFRFLLTQMTSSVQFSTPSGLDLENESKTRIYHPHT